MTNTYLQAAEQEYADVEQQYIDALSKRGLKFASRKDPAIAKKLKEELADRGAKIRNGGASIIFDYLSPACVACTDNVASETFSTTFKCHRDCYFCFNKNQPEYEHFFKCGCPWEERMEEAYREQNGNFACIALSGGEPLLNFDETVRFFEKAKELFPEAHKRLYTSGDLLSEEMAKQLADLGLDEIRFSIKDDDPKEMQESVFAAMRIAKKHIPSVMVEMPIVPGAEDHMKFLFKEFEDIGIDGINLLEFCFPFNNWDEYEKRGFMLKNPPFDVMYDYGYSGGLAVDGSEELILDLMKWAIDEGLTFGMHYCSLDNKHRSEIRIKNERFPSDNGILSFDDQDFFLKAAKVFGDDIEPVKAALEEAGCDDMRFDSDENSLLFPLSYKEMISGIKRSDDHPIDVRACCYVYEEDEDGGYIIDAALMPIDA